MRAQFAGQIAFFTATGDRDPRCPRPPIPRMATKSPGPAPVRRNELNMVSPAQAIGAASTADSSSGMPASAVAGTTKYSAYPPGNVAPVTIATSQCTKSPRRQLRQWPQ
jgi:hypothetical protein